MKKRTSRSGKSVSEKVAALSDAEIGRVLRNSRAFRGGKRRRGHQQRWSVTEERLLLKFPDHVVAEKLGRSLRSVKRRRWSLGVFQRPLRKWTASEDRMLRRAGPKVSARELAKKLGRTSQAVQARRWGLMGARFKNRPWTADENRLLGTMYDYQVAALLGRNKAGVASHRILLGIPAKIRRRNWSAKENALLGKFRDQTVAAKLGRTTAGVRKQRRKLGIAAFVPRPA